MRTFFHGGPLDGKMLDVSRSKLKDETGTTSTSRTAFEQGLGYARQSYRGEVLYVHASRFYEDWRSELGSN